ncbi:MAG TPA: HAD family hydrolase [Candidatus Caldiarchaeum subterraneum]|uniref:HAD family hydrolase n=1 Tax=Caldiarchaeum subterraneum TaxID=311458 RepID=A0A832ZUP7_CALS0|nr:HAD family hydrolase [Candidatus Caldarchaeum subterraneum]
MKKEPAVIVFDLDGTLIKFKLNVNAAKLDIIRTLADMGVDVSGLSTQSGVQEMINTAVKQLGDDMREDVKEKVLSIMRRYELEASREAEARDGVHKLLALLKERGYKIAVATNTHRAAAEEALRKTKLLEQVDALITREEVERLKPSGDLLRKVMKVFNAKPSEILFIGDSVHDAKAAKEVGVTFIGVEGGIHDGERLLQNSAKTVIKQPLELMKILEQLSTVTDF